MLGVVQKSAIAGILAILLVNTAAGLDSSVKFPDFTCHKGYDDYWFPGYKRSCKWQEIYVTERPQVEVREYAEHYKCAELCLAHQYLYMLQYDHEIPGDGNSARIYRLNGTFSEDVRSRMANLVKDIEEESAKTLQEKIKNNCEEILNRVANVEKLKCQNWDPFYECVNDALKC